MIPEDGRELQVKPGRQVLGKLREFGVQFRLQVNSNISRTAVGVRV